MTLPKGPVVSLGDLALKAFEDGKLFQGADASFGALLGLRNMGVRYNEIPSGHSGCPFHNHHVADEMFVILEGEGTYRFGSGSHAFKAGDVLGAPAGGPDTAHQIINTGPGTLRYLGIATVAGTEVCEYPDSGKFQVISRIAPERTLRHIGREGQNDLDYYDGEPGA